MFHPSYPATQPLLPNSHQHKQNLADSGIAEISQPNPVTDLMSRPIFFASAGTSRAQAREDRERARARVRELLTGKPCEPSMLHFLHYQIASGTLEGISS